MTDQADLAATPASTAPGETLLGRFLAAILRPATAASGGGKPNAASAIDQPAFTSSPRLLAFCRNISAWAINRAMWECPGKDQRGPLNSCSLFSSLTEESKPALACGDHIPALA